MWRWGIAEPRNAQIQGCLTRFVPIHLFSDLPISLPHAPGTASHRGPFPGRVLYVSQTALWVFTISMTSQSNRSDLSKFIGIVNDSTSKFDNFQLVIAVIYNLPDRECGTSASTGELCWISTLVDETTKCDMTAKNECDAGLKDY